LTRLQVTATRLGVRVPRRKRYIKKNGVHMSPRWGGGSGTRESVMKAAEVFRDQARLNASKFSQRIPLSTDVVMKDENTAQVVTDGQGAPNAAPFTFGLRHPLFGDERYWYKQPVRDYMGRAAKTALNRAAEVYADEETKLLAEEFGFTEE